MTILQEYLNQKYLTQEEKVKEIDIKKINQERKDRGLIDYKLEGGSLNLSKYSNLEKVKIEGWRLKAPLTHLDISNCPFEGSLKLLEDLSGLEQLNISNTNLREGLEYLPENCKKIYCNSNYLYKSTKIMEELDKSKCLTGEGDDKYYDLDKWRTDKANNSTASIIPLERLFVIRSNLKQFLKKWSKDYEESWYERPLGKLRTKECKPTELSKLKNPNEINTYWYVGEGGQWIARGVTVDGGVLAATTDPILGGVLAAASTIVEVFATQMKEKLYETRQNKWNQFLTDADAFLDNYHELLGILKKLNPNSEIGKINKTLIDLNNKTKRLLKIYDENKKGEEGYEEIDLQELIDKRTELTQDLENKEKSKWREIVKSIGDLEDIVVDYQKRGSSIEKEEQENNLLWLEKQLTTGQQIKNNQSGELFKENNQKLEIKLSTSKKNWLEKTKNILCCGKDKNEPSLKGQLSLNNSEKELEIKGIIKDLESEQGKRFLHFSQGRGSRRTFC